MLTMRTQWIRYWMNAVKTVAGLALRQERNIVILNARLVRGEEIISG
jgi:hypothetical protein